MNVGGKLLEAVKRAAIDAVKSTNPVEVIYGTVTEASEHRGGELKVRLQQKQEIGRRFFIESRLLDGRRVGDRLLILKIQGGQKFYVLEVLGNDT